ncbi:MAG: PIG-L family deacetylase [Candidatus Aminicenantaceae bacterium]
MGQREKQKKSRKVGIIVAHPDDEILWTGGSILIHPEWECFIYTLCRRSDPDRSHKFFKVVQLLKATGKMADLEDGPDQRPLPETNIYKTIINLIKGSRFDLVITHSPWGEYTRHRRHEEIGKALLSLWGSREIQTKEMWLFAYEDGQGAYYPLC